ncbi:ubiquinone anaerobic biosynthesis accessory factor UbiT [Rouxiella chamberiensis]|uniref:Ubiquinone biosynthesis accessory factor UbiT n=1 Tax=Rouxiella chamberiensis TaxID=1513468 RepID=A0ABY7HNS1_9GAMM|nr:SCP2 domain-containing protein [Rouxiella chamberiensis]WAT00975.1 SCP2 domain-containing protein [Rouxiella chamberiensis]
MLQKRCVQLRAQWVHQGPSLLKVPAKFIPFALKRKVLEQLLGWQFQEALDEGELDFLNHRWLRIEITDLDLQWLMTLENGKLRVCRHGEADVSFSGNANDLILVAARREDPDTLFFQRRLRIEGDTELGLNVKNLMDSIELDSMPALLRHALDHLAAFVEAGRQEDGELFSPAVSPC